MSVKQLMKIYYLNRYDLHNPEKFRMHSGYEQIVKYSSQFYRVDKNNLLQKILKKIINKKLPKNYLSSNLSKEFLVFFKVIFSKKPVFYLYADKDAFLLPLLKRKFKLSRIKIYGTLHWHPEESKQFSFYKYNLYNEFNGIIGLSHTINSLNYKNTKIIPHGIDLSYWQKRDYYKDENLYLIIGVSNRDHEKQKEIIELIRQIDTQAKFVLIAAKGAVRHMYKDVCRIHIEKEFVKDAELRGYYTRAKAVILFQNKCLASNVVLEAIAMCVPIITNLVGDISEYLGDDYPLYITENNKENKLREFCSSNALRERIIDRFKIARNQFDWSEISRETIKFIEQDEKLHSKL